MIMDIGTDAGSGPLSTVLDFLSDRDNSNDRS